MIVAAFQYLKIYFVEEALQLLCMPHDLEAGSLRKLQGKHSGASVQHSEEISKSHAGIEREALGDSEFSGTGDGQAEIRSHLVGLS